MQKKKRTHHVLANRGRQPLRAASAGDEATLGLGQGEVGRLGRHNQVALLSRKGVALASLRYHGGSTAQGGGGRALRGARRRISKERQHPERQAAAARSTQDAAHQPAAGS